MQDPKSRFSDRAENYARYRPGYPREILGFLEEGDALGDDTVVADVGSGTGALSVLFLENGNTVLGVEPNREMRRAAEGLLRDHHLFEASTGQRKTPRSRMRASISSWSPTRCTGSIGMPRGPSSRAS
jgi:SAM-dependent methyltransferase